MKRLILFFLLFCSMLSPITHASEQTLLLSVPFQNISLGVNNTLQASFAFNGRPIIFCFEGTQQQGIGIVTWPYQGKPQTSTLALSLKTDSKYQGFFSDPSGTISITNNTAVTLFVSCLFGF